MNNKELKERLSKLENQFKKAQSDLIRIDGTLSLLEEILKDDEIDAGVTIDLPGKPKKDYSSINFTKI